VVLASAYATRFDVANRWWISGPLLVGTYLLPLATVAAVGLLALLIWRRSRRIEFDAGRATVGELARSLVVPGAERPWSEENVYLAVRRLVAQGHGCRPLEVTWTTRLGDRRS
jgi:hypothetical protein